MSYGVRDSRAPDVPESLHPHIKDAIREAMRSGLDVYVHAEDCDPGRPLGADCPCRPVLIPRAEREPGAAPFRPIRRRP